MRDQQLQSLPLDQRKGWGYCIICNAKAEFLCVKEMGLGPCDTCYCKDHHCPVHPPGWEERERQSRMAREAQEESARNRNAKLIWFFFLCLLFGVMLQTLFLSLK